VSDCDAERLSALAYARGEPAGWFEPLYAEAASGRAIVPFDLSPTAVRVAQERHPQSSVRYEVADLLDLPATYRQAFDLVLESYGAEIDAFAGDRLRASNVERLVDTDGTARWRAQFVAAAARSAD
jgi:hypothetical protein